MVISILDPLGQETLVRLRAVITVNSKDGTHELDWTTPVTATFYNCMVEPPLIGNRLLVEDTKARDFVDSLFKAYIPGNPDVRYDDRIQWRGDTYEVRSAPQLRVDFDGNTDHVQLMLELKAG